MAQIKQYELKDGIEYVKIHGLQRTGTNYLAHLVNENYQNVKALINAGGWKHGHYCAPWTLGREVNVLTVTKNPYAWLASLYKYWRDAEVGPDLSKITFEQFVKTRAVFEMQQGVPYLYRADNPVQHWNNMNFHWLSIRMNKKKTLTVPYESLLLDCEGVVEAIAKDFGLKRAACFVNPKKTFLPGQEEVKLSDEDWNSRDYYLKEEFLNHYTPDLLKFVNRELDPEVMDLLGYNLI